MVFLRRSFLKFLKISSNSRNFPQTEALAQMLAHTSTVSRDARKAAQCWLWGVFFSLNPHDPTAHCNIPMEHTIVYKRVLQLYFPQTPGISSNSLIFLKFIAFRAISRSCRCLQYPIVSIIDSWDGGGCTVVLFVFCFSQMFAFYPVIFCET